MSCRARFGPNGIRQGSRRLSVESMNVPMKTRISDHLRVVDCGDIREWCLQNIARNMC